MCDPGGLLHTRGRQKPSKGPGQPFKYLNSEVYLHEARKVLRPSDTARSGHNTSPPLHADPSGGQRAAADTSDKVTRYNEASNYRHRRRPAARPTGRELIISRRYVACDLRVEEA